jgi:hypothetical protein
MNLGARSKFVVVLLLLSCLVPLVAAAQSLPPLRPPAVPLIAHDPYFSIWSMADRLTDENTKHWTGSEQPLTGLARIDGKVFRFMGGTPRGMQAEVMTQDKLELTATRTRYSFSAAGIRLDLTFLTPALPDDLDVLSRPVTYLVWEVQSVDGKTHEVSLYFDAASHLATNTPEQKVAWSRMKVGNLQVLRMGATDQQILARSGDNLRIEWGYLYLAAPPQAGLSTYAGGQRARNEFLASGRLPDSDDLETPPQTNRNVPVLAAAFNLGAVGRESVVRRLMLAYDDLFSLQYFNRNLRPWWRRHGEGAADLLRVANDDYPALAERCRRYDEQLTQDLISAGGGKYAGIAILAFRQALAAHKLAADIDGSPIYFSKENFSNGCINTVDVFYPSSPLFLLLNPALLKGSVGPVLEYASLPRWPFAFAPHDLGQYPLANGQVYGGGEKNEIDQMPVEESGNMLILTAAIAKAEGHAEFARKHWAVLKKWAEYLKLKGMDPENQLCTDDFAGHLAHNTNLSLKAIVALGAYAQLAEKLGETAESEAYRGAAREMAAKWGPMADDGDHYRLAFDKSGTWSQKYNLVWDRVLGLNLFPGEIARKEIAYYRKMQNTYGLPLDNRESYTKSDWVVWTATLAENRADFEAIIDPLFRSLGETSSRVPMTDWYWTKDAKQRGFQARSVVGGVFMKALAARWAKRD